MAYNIAHHVSTIIQPSATDCWAAALAMIMGRHSNSGTAHVKQVCAEHSVLPNGARRLEYEDVPRACRALQLRCHDIRRMAYPTLEQLAAWMRAGAIAVFGDVDFEVRREDHVLVFNRLYGDGNEFGTSIGMIDPYNGRVISHSYSVNRATVVRRIDFVVGR